MNKILHYAGCLEHPFLHLMLLKPVQAVIDRSHDKGKATRFLTQTYGRDTLRKTGDWTATCIHQECSSCLFEEQ